MRTIKLCLAGAALLPALASNAQGQGFGLGFILGEPTGISLKGWLDDRHAIDGAVAWSLGHGSSMHVHADYLFHKFEVIKVSKGKLPIYYGPGIRLRFWGDEGHWHNGEWHHEDGNLDFAVRFPIGLNYQFGSDPLDVFLEVVPSLGLIPSTYVDFDGGLGMRYWF